MSRWINDFDNHVFRATWEDLKEKLEQSEANNTVPTDVQELARLKKVITYLDNALNNIDPELIPSNILVTFNQQAVPCKDQINAFNSNLNIGHIVNANNNADNLLSYIRPYMIHESSMKKTLLASVRAYSTEMEKSIQKFNELVSNQVEEIESSKQKIDVYEADSKHELEISEEYKNKILDFYAMLLEGTDGETSIETKISNFQSDIEHMYEELELLHMNALQDDENNDKVSIKTSLRLLKEKLENDVEDTDTLLVNIKQEIKQFDEFYIKIFGKLNEHEEREDGLKQELDNRLTQIKKYEKTQQDKHTALFKKIEKLLPGATSAGLSKAYKDMKDSFIEPINNWNLFFIGSIILMFAATFISFVHVDFYADGHYAFSFADTGTIDQTFNNLLYKMPLYAPLIWLAIFASKRRSEAQRLQQEYSHKEALAKSYDSYKTQIEELGKDDQDMLLKLIENAISTMSYNASETLDGKHGDSTPLQETVKQVTDLQKVFK